MLVAQEIRNPGKIPISQPTPLTRFDVTTYEVTISQPTPLSRYVAQRCGERPHFDKPQNFAHCARTPIRESSPHPEDRPGGAMGRESRQIERQPFAGRQSGIAFFWALANNAASSGEASSAKDCGGWTDRGRGLIAIQAAAKCTVKGAEPTHQRLLSPTDKVRRGRLVWSDPREKQPRAGQRRSKEAYADGALVR